MSVLMKSDDVDLHDGVDRGMSEAPAFIVLRKFSEVDERTEQD